MTDLAESQFMMSLCPDGGRWCPLSLVDTIGAIAEEAIKRIARLDELLPWRYAQV